MYNNIIIFIRHAGIYSAVEANAILRDKLSRLQELYVDQFKVLQQELKIKKMKMIPALRREYETLCKYIYRKCLFCFKIAS